MIILGSLRPRSDTLFISQLASFLTITISKFDPYLIKRYFEDQATSSESYFVLRNNFARSYATMCICHWILGIGDRHLDNVMFNTKTGKVVGIDFGHAFGYGTRELPVPELMPFRLTQQIINVMEPLGVTGILHRSMFYTLQCLRRQHSTILSTMAVFVNEPAINWLEEDNEVSWETNRSVWDPETRVETSRRKLLGANSLKITLEEVLKNKKRKDPICKNTFETGYKKQLQACPGYSNEENMTVEKQLEVLLQHATNRSLLALMFLGWMPFI